MAARECDILGRGPLGLRIGITAEALEERDARTRRACAVQILPREHAEAERRIGQEAAVLPNGDLGETDLEGSVQETVRILDADHARQAVLLREREEAHQPPGGFVGDTDLPNLAGPDLIGEHLECFQQGHAVGVLHR